jgi:hypothetical protein
VINTQDRRSEITTNQELSSSKMMYMTDHKRFKTDYIEKSIHSRKVNEVNEMDTSVND